MLMANAPAANVGLAVHAKAGVHTPVSACASSNEAISLALDQLRLGRADIAVVGGTEATIHPLPIAAFGQMQALSRRNDDPEGASRPWDRGRDGFVMGEGSAIMILETLEHARARGAKIYGTIAGAGITADSHDIVQPDPTGEGQSGAMIKALADAELTPTDIKHVNAHGTSTPQGDITEAGSIRTALGDATDEVVVTSTKSMTGHLLGGAGALETIATLLALRDRMVPPDDQPRGPRARPRHRHRRQRLASACPRVTWPRSTTPSASADTTWPSWSPTPTRVSDLFGRAGVRAEAAPHTVCVGPLVQCARACRQGLHTISEE